MGISIKSNIYFLFTKNTDSDLVEIKCKNCSHTLKSYVLYGMTEEDEKGVVVLYVDKLERDKSFNYCNNCGFKLKE